MSDITAPFTLTLKSYWRSSASWRVRIALELKRLPYQYEPVHLVRDGGEQHQPAHLAINPMAQVPHLTVVDRDGSARTLTQSVAILTLLDHLAPEPLIFPSDPWRRARVIELVEVVNSGIQPIQNLSVLQAVQALGGDKVTWAREAISRGLKALEWRCQSDATLCEGPFVMGEQPGAFEAALIPQLYNARRFSVDLEAYPRLLELEEACEALEAFKRAAPESQPDAQR